MPREIVNNKVQFFAAVESTMSLHCLETSASSMAVPLQAVPGPGQYER